MTQPIGDDTFLPESPGTLPGFCCRWFRGSASAGLESQRRTSRENAARVAEADDKGQHMSSKHLQRRGWTFGAMA